MVVGRMNFITLSRGEACCLLLCSCEGTLPATP